MKRLWTIAAISYAVVGVVTFGHSAATHERIAAADQAACLAGREHVCIDDPTSPVVGLMGGLLWPLYWSWEAFS